MSADQMNEQDVSPEPPLEMLQGMKLADLAPYDVEAGLAQFEASTVSAPVSAGKVGLWVALAGAGVAAAVFAMSVGGDPEPTVGSATPPEPESSPAPAVKLDTGPRRPERILAPTGDRDAPVAGPEPTPKATAPGARARRIEAPATAKPDPAEEIRLASEMRRALATDPGRALKLAEEGEQQFPGGMFSRERKGHAILALVALDRMDEARSRARDYLARYPGGAQSDRIRKAVGGL